MGNELIEKMNGKFELTKDKIDLIKKTIAKDATDLELQMFLHLCKQYELDPMLREISFLKRKVWNSYRNDYDSVPTMMVNRDGHLAIAFRTGQFNGMRTSLIGEFKGAISEYDIIPEGVKLVGAKTTVWSKACEHPIEVSVSFKEYCVMGKDGSPQALWKTKPAVMISKVSEATALRRAFNIHSIYTSEEMQSEIAKDMRSDMESVSDALKLTESVHGKTADDYKAWAEGVMTRILDALGSAKTEQDVKSIEHDKDIPNLNETDRKYIEDMITSAWQNVISGGSPEEALNEEGRKAMGIGSLEPSSSIPEGQSATKPVAFASLAEQEKAGQEFLKEFVQVVETFQTKAQVNAWKHKVAKSYETLLPEQKDYVQQSLKFKMTTLKG